MADERTGWDAYFRLPEFVTEEGVVLARMPRVKVFGLTAVLNENENQIELTGAAGGGGDVTAPGTNGQMHYTAFDEDDVAHFAATDLVKVKNGDHLYFTGKPGFSTDYQWFKLPQGEVRSYVSAGQSSSTTPVAVLAAYLDESSRPGDNVTFGDDVTVTVIGELTATWSDGGVIKGGNLSIRTLLRRTGGTLAIIPPDTVVVGSELTMWTGPMPALTCALTDDNTYEIRVASHTDMGANVLNVGGSFHVQIIPVFT